MEEYLQEWSMDSTSVLEPLQPLSTDWVEKETSDVNVKVESFSRGETANKLLAELDQQKDETEPYYSWNETTEKFQSSLFDDYYATSSATGFNGDLKFNILSTPTFAYPQLQHNIFPSNALPQQIQQQQIQLQHQDFLCDGLASASLTSSSSSSSSSPKFQPKENRGRLYSNDASSASSKLLITKEAAPVDQELLLTPPDSPKEEEILKFLEEMNPDVLEELVKCEVKCLESSSVTSAGTAASMASLSDGGASECSGVQEEDLSSSDYYISSSPFVSSDSSLDEQMVNSPVSVRQHYAAPSSTSSSGGNGIRSGGRAARKYISQVRTGTNDDDEDGDDDDDDDDYEQRRSIASKQQRRRIYKPYARVAGEEKKERKKEQNKNAATRYRMKKKAEVEVVLLEEKELEIRNKILKEDLNEICREIKYLKSLMRDVYKAKGLLQK